MLFSTPVTIPAATWQITYDDRLLMLGSCFTDHIARQLEQYYLRVVHNPDGTLYNPVSVARHLTRERAEQCEVIVITFGTAWVYVDKDTDTVVDNCQKRPATAFRRQRLTVNEIVNLWKPLLEQLVNHRFLFTVSPIRHQKDGLHENQLSKAILMLAIDELVKVAPERIAYFPAYEILMDELRDYRFYASDMFHPSQTAIDYISERFAATYLLSPATRLAMRELHQLWLDRQHRPIHVQSDENQHFQSDLQQRVQQLQMTYPWIA